MKIGNRKCRLEALVNLFLLLGAFLFTTDADAYEDPHLTTERHEYVFDMYCEYVYQDGILAGGIFYDEFGGWSGDIEIDNASQQVLHAFTDQEEIWCNEDGLLIESLDINGTHCFYDYDENGRLIGRQVYDTDSDELVYWNTYRYDETGRPEYESQADPSEEHLVETIYIYTEKSSRRREIYFNGELDYYWIDEFDKNGNMIRCTDYDPDGNNISGWANFIYDGDGNNTIIQYCKNDGTILEVIMFTYDHRGNVLECIHYTPNEWLEVQNMDYTGLWISDLSDSWTVDITSQNGDTISMKIIGGSMSHIGETTIENMRLQGGKGSSPYIDNWGSEGTVNVNINGDELELSFVVDHISESALYGVDIGAGIYHKAD